MTARGDLIAAPPPRQPTFTHAAMKYARGPRGPRPGFYSLCSQQAGAVEAAPPHWRKRLAYQALPAER